MPSSSSDSDVPGWVFDIKEPKKFVLSTVLGFLITGIATFVETSTMTVVNVWTRVNVAVRQAGFAVDQAFAAAGNALVGVEDVFLGVFIDVGLNGGVAAPLAQAILFVIVLGLLMGALTVFVKLFLAISPIP